MRTKLFVGLAVPTAAFLALAVLSGVTWYDNADRYGRDVGVAELGRHVTAVVHELQAERDLSVGFMSNGRAKSSADDSWTQRLSRQQSAVDAAFASFRSAVSVSSDDLEDQASRVADRALADAAGLGELRAAVRGNGLTAGAIFAQYSATISNLLDLDTYIGDDGPTDELRDEAVVLDDLSELKEISSQVRAQLFAVTAAGRFEFGQPDDLSSLLAAQSAAESTFRADAGPDTRALYDQVVTGQAVLTVKRISDLAIDRQRLTRLNIDAEQWFAASTTHLELLRSVETRLLDNVIARAHAARSDAWQRTVSIGVLVVGILLAAVLLSLAIATSMTRSLRTLRANALHVAHERLPGLVEELRTADPDVVDASVRSIGFRSRDEIGEVARTFDELQREAVRLAVEQAGLRRNVNALFLSLSRRSQSLIERQISLIDRLEASEENPAQLENLFKLDHLATRMRRNSENLLVLAGSGPGRRRSQPVPLADVLRAANGEIEQYERVHITDIPETSVVASCVIHLVHLVAELLENAAQFSPPHEPVELAATALEGGSVMIMIEDSGLGMPPAELAEANRRLAEPPLFDFSIAQRLGLFVVARLADRHEITVRLVRSVSGGLRAMVHLPVTVLDWTAPSTAAVAVPADGPLVPAGGPRGQRRGLGPWAGVGSGSGTDDPFAPLSGNWFSQRGPSDTGPNDFSKNGFSPNGFGRNSRNAIGADLGVGGRPRAHGGLPAIEEAVAALRWRRRHGGEPESAGSFHWFERDSPRRGCDFVPEQSSSAKPANPAGRVPLAADPVADSALPVRVPQSSAHGGAWLGEAPLAPQDPDAAAGLAAIPEQLPGHASPFSVSSGPWPAVSRPFDQDSAVAEPEGSEPAAAGPAVSEPAAAGPAVSEPAAAEPAGSGPVVADPEWIRGRLSRLYEGVNHARETQDGTPPPRRPDSG